MRIYQDWRSATELSWSFGGETGGKRTSCTSNICYIFALAWQPLNCIATQRRLNGREGAFSAKQGTTRSESKNGVLGASERLQGIWTNCEAVKTILRRCFSRMEGLPMESRKNRPRSRRRALRVVSQKDMWSKTTTCLFVRTAEKGRGEVASY